jgi:hypothetical protein
MTDRGNRISEAIRVPLPAREEQKSHTLEDVGGDDDRVGSLHTWPAQGVEIFDATRPAIGVSDDARYPALRTQIEIAGR